MATDVAADLPPPLPVALWRLARPSGMPLVLALPFTGYVYGHWEWGLDAKHPADILWLLAGWFLLSAGTLWLNATLDQDDGEVLMGPRTPLPPGLVWWAAGALLAAIGVTLPAGLVPTTLVGVCVGLSVAYSAPTTAWKAHPVLGPVVNVLGYGVLSPLAGWWVADVAPTPRAVATLVLLACWVAATYYGAQGFQAEEDRRRGYRTLVAVRGEPVTISVARALYGVSVGGLLGLAAIGWYPRALWLGLPLVIALDRHLASWAAHPERGATAARGMLRRATLLAVGLVAIAVLQHLWDIFHGGAPAGLGTVWTPRAGG
ncbi:MAG: UbiA family prenyltransferase [Myxococcales bacterium]|nr:UbiA family prenyltransferase [Myxococcales bacterium]MCA9571392.1 UbiA family prenyltransferase [Myxococcales bacterium]